MGQAKIKQIKGLQTVLDSITGIDTITETFSTSISSGLTGIVITLSSRETDNTKVYINGQLVDEDVYSWYKDGVLLESETLDAGSELFWDSTKAGFELEESDRIEIIYETVGSGNNLENISGDRGVVTGNLIPDSDEAYDLGSPTNKFRDLYLSGNTLYMGGQPLSVVNGQLTLNGSVVSGSLDTMYSTHTIAAPQPTTSQTTYRQNIQPQEYRVDPSNLQNYDVSEKVTDDGAMLTQLVKSSFTGFTISIDFYDFNYTNNQVSTLQSIASLSKSNLSVSVLPLSRFGVSYDSFNIRGSFAYSGSGIDGFRGGDLVSEDGKTRTIVLEYTASSNNYEGQTINVVRYNSTTDTWDILFEIESRFRDPNLGNMTYSGISGFQTLINGPKPVLYMSKDGNCIYSSSGECLRWNGTTYLVETIFSTPHPDSDPYDFYIDDSYNSDIVCIITPSPSDPSIIGLNIYHRDLNGNWNSTYSSSSTDGNTVSISGDGFTFIEGLNVFRYVNNSWVLSTSPVPIFNNQSSPLSLSSYNAERIIAQGRIYDYDSINDNWDYIAIFPEGGLGSLSLETIGLGTHYFRKFISTDNQYLLSITTEQFVQSGAQRIYHINRVLNEVIPNSVAFDPSYYKSNADQWGWQEPWNMGYRILENPSSYTLYDFYFPDPLLYKKNDRCIIYSEDEFYLACIVFENLNNVLKVLVFDGSLYSDGYISGTTYTPYFNTYSIKPYY